MTAAALSPADERTLVAVGLDAIVQVLDTGRFTPPPTAAFGGPLAEPGATFVTLTLEGALLGCIGTLAADRPLVVDVAYHAVAAGFADPRLPPITAREYPEMDMKISVLGALEAIAVDGLEELVEALEPGLDGLLVESRAGHATFLPSVWEQLPDPVDFLDALWRKAGWARRTWPEDLRVSRYAAHEISDDAPRSLPTRRGERVAGVPGDR